MKVNIENAVDQACCLIKKSNDDFAGGYAYVLKEMINNLKEMKTRKSEGEKVLDEFFNIYVFNADEK